MDTHTLSPDTQAILLLCGIFGPSSGNAEKPFTLREYNKVVQWLLTKGFRPGDLLAADTLEQLLVSPAAGSDPARTRGLLERGAAMAFFVESWSNSGGWIVSRSDSAYPTRLKTRLRQSAPPVLYGIGNRDLLEVGGVAVVGARNADEPSLEFTRRVATRCAELEIPVISGGARGVDRTAMLASLSAGGEVVGVLANNLSRAAVSGEFREFLLDDMLALVSPYHPKARFFVGHAMGRNKHIYALSDMALAVSVTEGKGGTWSGAVENEKHGWVPLYVRAGNAVPAGNEQLLRRGALPLQDDLQEIDRVAQHWRSECGRAANRSTSIPQRAQISAIPEGQDPSQLNLF